MSVFKRSDSACWWYDFQCGGYRFSGSTGVPCGEPKREAQAVEDAKRAEARQAVAFARAERRRPLTVEGGVGRWWDEVGQYTQESDLKDALAWLSSALGARRPLHGIRSDDVAQAVAQRRQDRVKAGRDENGAQQWRPVSPRTVNRTVTILLRRVMNRARDVWGAPIVAMPKWSDLYLREKKRPIREITIAEERRLEGAERDDFRAIRRFAIITGLRLNEVLLTWSQVDFDNAVIRIIAKGDEPRIIPLSKASYGLLWAERGRHREYVFTFIAQRNRTCPHTGQRYVKGSRYPITYWGLSTRRRRDWKKAGVDARFHDLRHTAGMRTLRATGNLKTTQRLLGHSDIATTSKFYTDALVEDIRAAMEVTQAAVDSHENSHADISDQSKPLKDKV